MAYARFGHDSDVYVFRDTRNQLHVYCARDVGLGKIFHNLTIQRACDILTQVQSKGLRVPSQVLTCLAFETDPS